MLCMRGVIKLNVSRQRPMEEERYIHVKILDNIDFLAHCCEIYFVKKYMKKGKGGLHIVIKKKKSHKI